MKTLFLKRWLSSRRAGWLLVALVGLFVAMAVGNGRLAEVRHLAAATLGQWVGRGQVGESCDAKEHEDHEHGKKGHCGEEAHDHEEHGHCQSKVDDHRHDEAAAIKLSRNAEENVGVRLEKIHLGSFERTISVPAMVVERPGRSAVQVAAPLTGVVTRIWPLQGETVSPGQPLFDLRLTHEEVVEGQTQYLRTAEELDVLEREIGRLEKVTAAGAVASKILLERQYERQKLRAVFHAQRQGLLLHGLSPRQIDEIVTRHALVSEMTVHAPVRDEARGKADAPPSLQVEELKVTEGQHVKVGDPLCVLADHRRLYIQGKAFEQDAAALNKAAGSDWPVTAVVAGEAGGQQRQKVPGLSIVYLANRIEPESRAFLFYVELPNELLRIRQSPDGHRFATWRYRPGQRVELLVPVERWAGRIVLPQSAVVQDAAESYVFEKNDGHFDRRAVRLEYRDQYSAVIANDGTLTPGKTVVVAGAYQVHLALKNKSSAAPDPHAGHNH